LRVNERYDVAPVARCYRRVVARDDRAGEVAGVGVGTAALGAVATMPVMERPMLDRLDGRLVFSVTPQPDGTFVFTEGCDNYFSVTLTTAEVLQLAGELCALALNVAGRSTRAASPPPPL
jgi:hypothetical protein